MILIVVIAFVVLVLRFLVVRVVPVFVGVAMVLRRRVGVLGVLRVVGVGRGIVGWI